MSSASPPLSLPLPFVVAVVVVGVISLSEVGEVGDGLRIPSNVNVPAGTPKAASNPGSIMASLRWWWFSSQLLQLCVRNNRSAMSLACRTCGACRYIELSPRNMALWMSEISLAMCRAGCVICSAPR